MKWANMAVYNKANTIFQMRRIPGVVIKLGMLIRCETSEYRTISIEIIAGLYIGVAAEKIEATED